MRSKWFVGVIVLLALIAIGVVWSLRTASSPQVLPPPADTKTTQSPPAAVSKNVFFTHNSAGKTWVDQQGRLRGKRHAGRRAFNIELVNAMADVRGIDITIKDVPFKRGFREVKQGRAAAIFNVMRTADREESVKWVGPMQKELAHFYELVSKPTGITSLEEARGIESIAVVDGTISLDFLKKKNFQNLVLTNSYKACFGMLKTGRAQLTVATPVTLPSRHAIPGLKPEDIQSLPFVVFEVSGCMAFSPATPDSEIAAWQAALEKLQATGAYKKLVDEYLDVEPKD